MRHAIHAEVGQVRREAVIRQRVADAIRGAIELLESPSGALDGWQLHHLAEAAIEGRQGRFDRAMHAVTRAALPLDSRPESEMMRVSWRPKHASTLFLELNRLEDVGAAS